jgi:hypothetical protein
MLIESYRLADDGSMIRTIRIVHDDTTVLDVRQIFDRS